MFGIINISIVLGLVVLFFVSLFLFIKRMLVNAAIRKNESIKNGEKLNIIIEQNEKIISLMEDR